MMGRRAQGDVGLTLVELMVAVALTSIVLVAVGTVFIGSLRSLRVINAKTELNSTAEIGMKIVTARLRSADYAPPENANPSAVLEATYNAMTVTAYLRDPALATSLANSIVVADPTSSVAAYLRSTGLVPKRVRYTYVANAAACGTKPGVTETITSPRYNLAAGQIFAWDAVVTPIVTRCVLRTTKAPSLVAPVYSMFKYYPDCSSTTEVSTLSDIGGVLIDLEAADIDNTTVGLQNRICLVNVLNP